jgi:hypothetical protein
MHPAGAGLAAYHNPNWVPAHLLGWVSVMLMQLGLVGLYGRQVEEMAWLGLVGFVLAFIGTAFAGAIQFLESTVLPLVAAQASTIFVQARTPPPYAVPLLALGFGLGYVLFGIATMRAGVLPRWSGLLLSIGVFLFIFAEVIREALHLSGVVPYVIGTSGQGVMALSLVWMGYALWREKREPVRRGSQDPRGDRARVR